MSPNLNATHSKRCAIYTRKSTDVGLNLEVNSLVSQREVCQAYIRSQAHRNWLELPHLYDDGGYSGGNLERPAMKRLLADIESGRIDIVVIYKVDRLSRSLTDFVRLMDVLQRHDVSFVSVTQTFDTSDSMGRLVLNILLTFSQFERELASERVRDKKAALKRRGLFTGGTPPFGFTLAKGGRLIVDEKRAEIVREMFERFPQVSANQLAKELRGRGCLTRSYRTRSGTERGGQPIYFSQVMKILTNPIYTGHLVHRGEWIRAKLEPLVSREQWDLVQEIRQTRFIQKRDPIQNFLLDILHDEQGRRMKVQRGTGRSNGYRCYKSEHSSWARGGICRKVMVNADRVEDLAISALKGLLADRVQVKQAILSLGLYSDETRKLLKRGPLACRRIAAMDRPQLRSLFLAIVPRAEVCATELTMYLSCFELSRFLGWDGIGVFQKSVLPPSRAADRVHEVRAPAFLICGHPYFALPIEPCPSSHGEPNPTLVDLIMRAGEYHDFVLANRSREIVDLAHEKGMGATQFARLLRLNYLAPDIQAAIIDGTQPSTLSRWTILHGPMPLDWEQQRQLMGFV
jgi:DNA invertase Pin-like site-specific DNA recombinase